MLLANAMLQQILDNEPNLSPRGKEIIIAVQSRLTNLTINQVAPSQTFSMVGNWPTKSRARCLTREVDRWSSAVANG